MKTVPLREVAEVKIGPFGSLLHKHDYVAGGVPLINPMHIQDGRIFPDQRHAVAPEKANQLSNYRLAQGDVVLGRRGEMGRCAVVRSDEQGFLCGTGSLIVRPGPLLSPKFLRLLFSSPDMVRTMERASLGTTMPNLNQKIVENLHILLPPLEEQRRIAAILNQADGLRDKQSEAQSTLDGLVDSIFLDMFGDPANQNRFESAALGDLVNFYSGGTPSKDKPEYWEGQLPWFSPKDLKKPYLWDSADHISEAVLSATAIRKLPADTVVLVVRGMILAHTVPVSLIRVPAAVNQDLKALLPRSPLDPLFLQTALRVQHQRILALVSTAAHGTKKLETQSLREVQIPRPGQAVEEEFSRRVRQSGRLSEELNQVKGELDSLFASLQSRAFAGQL